ncbi:ABC transporter ATP-binding protein [Marinomonas arenicola]|uniref:ABC transporter ATP-binding protein n=1 Tax=Marinomonas TaxID=28253 RepID=UPI001055FEA3|nr:ABC transporter ATP-binding protein [Marinomonas sp. KMM3893]
MTVSSHGQAAPLSTLHLDAGHGSKQILKDINLTIPDGKMTVLLGPNGSGKSTLLSTLARLISPMKGQVLLQGNNIAQLPTREVARQLGLLPQHTIVPEDLTVKDLVSRGRFPHQGFLKQWSKQDEAAVDHALAVTGTQELAERPVDSLSGGQRQRVWIAMVLAQETNLILLDEPTTFLDMRHQVELLEMLVDLVQQHGRTIVCVLHDLNLSLQYADHLIFLKEGEIRHTLSHPSHCNSKMVEEVFETQVLAVTHPETGLPIFLPKSQQTPKASAVA